MCEYCKENMKSKAIEDKYSIEIIISESFLYLYCDCGRHVVAEINYYPMCRKEAGRVTIREYVFKNNISYRQLARQLNISQAYLCDLSKGRRETISEEVANRFKAIAPEIDITVETRKFYRIR